MTVINRDLLKPSKVFKPSDDDNETEMNIDDNDDNLNVFYSENY
jgi:hypothetical protein